MPPGPGRRGAPGPAGRAGTGPEGRGGATATGRRAGMRRVGEDRRRRTPPVRRHQDGGRGALVRGVRARRGLDGHRAGRRPGAGGRRRRDHLGEPDRRGLLRPAELAEIAAQGRTEVPGHLGRRVRRTLEDRREARGELRLAAVRAGVQERRGEGAGVVVLGARPVRRAHPGRRAEQPHGVVPADQDDVGADPAVHHPRRVGRPQRPGQHHGAPQRHRRRDGAVVGETAHAGGQVVHQPQPAVRARRDVVRRREAGVRRRGDTADVAGDARQRVGSGWPVPTVRCGTVRRERHRHHVAVAPLVTGRPDRHPTRAVARQRRPEPVVPTRERLAVGHSSVQSSTIQFWPGPSCREGRQPPKVDLARKRSAWNTWLDCSRLLVRISQL